MWEKLLDSEHLLRAYSEGDLWVLDCVCPDGQIVRSARLYRTRASAKYGARRFVLRARADGVDAAVEWLTSKTRGRPVTQGPTTCTTIRVPIAVHKQVVLRAQACARSISSYYCQAMREHLSTEDLVRRVARLSEAAYEAGFLAANRLAVDQDPGYRTWLAGLAAEDRTLLKGGKNVEKSAT